MFSLLFVCFLFLFYFSLFLVSLVLIDCFHFWIVCLLSFFYCLFFVFVFSFLAASLFLLLWICCYHLSWIWCVCFLSSSVCVCVCVCVCVLFCCCCVLVFSVSLGFCLFVCFLSSLAAWRGLRALGSPARYQAWASVVGVLSPGHWTARESPGPGNINRHALSWRYPSQHQDPAPTNCLQAPVLDTSHQTTSKTGTQHHLSADRMHKGVLSSQPPQNTPPDAALPIRGKRLSSTHQSTGTSPSHQEALGPTSPTRGQITEARGTMTLQPVERRP